VKTAGKLFRTTAFKLSLAYFVLFSLGAFVVLGSVGQRVEAVLDEETAQNIDAEIARLTELFGEGGLRQLVMSIERRARAPGGSIFLVTTPAGEYIAGNIIASPMIGAEEGALDETIYRRRGEGADIHHHALAKLAILPGEFRVLVGHDVEDHRVLRRILRQGLGASLFWLALVGTLGGLFVAYRMLERVDAMSASARRIMAGDLDQRLEATGAGDELDRLAENLNAMLARIGQLMTGLSEVSDNIAHDLKTPLTRLRNRAEEVSRGDASMEQMRAALGAIIAESDALIRVFDALLTIARAEAGYSSDNLSEVDAGEIAADIAELYEPVAEQRGALLRSEAQEGLIVRGNRELLGRMLANLVDNALKYGVGGDKPSILPSILVSARRVGGSIEICVADRGPGVPPRDRERVIGRFTRLENSRSLPGSGLGLSLAAAVARLHHGSLRLEDNAPGLRAIVTLPAVASSRG
jgi:signal transduction histidine kinase